MPGPARIGVDIGGTFTDLVLLVEDRIAGVAKTLTTPADPSLAVAEGVARLLGEVPPAAVREVVHGTTLVSNALIERRGAVTSLVTTRGVRATRMSARRRPRTSQRRNPPRTMASTASCARLRPVCGRASGTTRSPRASVAKCLVFTSS